MPGSPPVVMDQGEPLRQLLEDPVQTRVLPLHPQIAERHPRNENHRGASAGDRKSHGHAIRTARIATPRNGSHRPTLSSGHEHEQDSSAAPRLCIMSTDPDAAGGPGAPGAPGAPDAPGALAALAALM